ncbi:MAG: RsmB/NOP family class I SAM-dependent RNA methyltransferase, partial [Burkholderiales bacterium]
MRPSRALLAHAQAVLAELLAFSRPADQAISAYFRSHRDLGQQDRAFIAETAFAVLRRKRSLAWAAGSEVPLDLAVAALVKVFGLSGRALEDSAALAARIKSASPGAMPPAVAADLPDWLWERLCADYGEAEAGAIAAGLLSPAPLDLRVNLAKISREDALARLQLEAAPTPHSPAGIRVKGKPAINRHPLFLDGSIEVQDEGSQLLAYLLAPRRGEMIADFCAGAGGKTLALSMLMQGSGRVYAMDVSEKRLRELSPRAVRAGISNVHPIVLSTENDIRAKRLAGKLDRVLVDAPCSGFGTLRRNPDLKWRHGAGAVAELAAKQARILAAAARLVKVGGRLVYATCSVLTEENEQVAQRFAAEHAEFQPLDCGPILAVQRVVLD